MALLRVSTGVLVSSLLSLSREGSVTYLDYVGLFQEDLTGQLYHGVSEVFSFAPPGSSLPEKIFIKFPEPVDNISLN